LTEECVKDGERTVVAVEGGLQLLKVAGKVHLSIEPALLGVVKVLRPRVDRQAGKDVFVGTNIFNEATSFLKRLHRFATVPEHHVPTHLDADVLCGIGHGPNFLGRNFLFDAVENRLRSRLNPETQSLAASEPHFAK
jgi:hypothetical protein